MQANEPASPDWQPPERNRQQYQRGHKNAQSASLFGAETP